MATNGDPLADARKSGEMPKQVAKRQRGQNWRDAFDDGKQISSTDTAPLWWLAPISPCGMLLNYLIYRAYHKGFAFIPLHMWLTITFAMVAVVVHVVFDRIWIIDLSSAVLLSSQYDILTTQWGAVVLCVLWYKTIDRLIEHYRCLFAYKWALFDYVKLIASVVMIATASSLALEAPPWPTYLGCVCCIYVQSAFFVGKGGIKWEHRFKTLVGGYFNKLVVIQLVLFPLSAYDCRALAPLTVVNFVMLALMWLGLKRRAGNGIATGESGDGPLEHDKVTSCSLCGVTQKQLRQQAKFLLFCSSCDAAAYCCKQHQKDDWKRHKKACKKARLTNSANPVRKPMLLSMQSMAIVFLVLQSLNGYTGPLELLHAPALLSVLSMWAK